MLTGSSLVTEKGQATIPAEIRRQHGIRPGDRVTFTSEGDHITVRRVLSLEEVFSSIRPKRHVRDPLAADKKARDEYFKYRARKHRRDSSG